MTKWSLVLSMLLVGLFINAGCTPKKAEIKSEEDKTFYVVGHMFGGRLANLKLNEKEVAAINLGLADAAAGVKPAFDVNSYQPKVQQMFRDRMSQGSQSEKDKGKKFIEEFLKKEAGSVQTASGLVYKVITPGTGKNPKETDTVEVHYHGTLIDGTVFDSSVDRGQKVEFPLNRVIKGWTEGLQLVKEGGKIKLVIPSDLAYGDAGAPDKIPGGATLLFEVELFKIK
ncbi:MAG: hypothetical protein A2504_12035 [Bdellovibrionales bacterium RIFOXYD12_FULL_39_22]|nr:MAG: hypothetical protein A2385_16550 [Bdellovibrionales bacterium RIFOXYB1_FULL_39_21]OFZ44434.1 MAG: hypothetical protein A2485_06345 [Bdellovibrionales bacterium RIFOXYC12_FULL_39_17]OFZ49924.1 MAG: hypothetical protein A2404_01120 [Bdellovibrionales bacterium RIFOXYC1_FULL_39_130]OFZ68515.1 MAG: hypothetical protein A2451_01865 [Bdellovibrionales bacterium RIFOXYC2_FULL_39_8]OFZ76929.1 MAG: hypothetical protein A2560_05920 [Bdellovibrionales bacterium RIFOXYD1_FULL_39_84]OFZ95856.1 MAG: